jgi:hypothetical protein
MPGKIDIDMTAAMKKTAALLKLGQASRKQATLWSAETVKMLKRQASSMRKSLQYPGGKKTGMLARNIGMVVVPSGEQGWHITLGTGVARTQTVPYAKIQDEGGVTHPRVTKRMRRWAWWAFGASGADVYRGIALTSKRKLTVKIPASKWFTNTLNYREQFLKQYMSPEAVLKTAQGMALGGFNAD